MDTNGFSSGLINNPVGSLWLMKMNGGVDCVGELARGSSPPFLRFHALRVIMYEAVPPNGVRVTSFTYFMLPAGDVDVDLHDKDIVTIMPCPENLGNAYRTAVSGIQVATPAQTRRITQ